MTVITHTPAIIQMKAIGQHIAASPPRLPETADRTTVQRMTNVVKQRPVTIRIKAKNIILLIFKIPDLLAISLQIACILPIALESGMLWLG